MVNEDKPVRPKGTSWVVVNGMLNRFVCERCGRFEPFILPMSIGGWCALGRNFVKDHRRCKERQGKT